MNLYRKVKRLFEKVLEIKFKYLLNGTKVTVEKGAKFHIGKNVKIKNSKIYVKNGNSLTIGDNTSILDANITMIVGEQSEISIGENCIVKDYQISLTGGSILIGNFSILEMGSSVLKPSFEIQGSLQIGEYNHILCDVWVRFNGNVVIGNRNAINEGTQVRSDEKVIIGDYNQISYNCAIWDTNTHTIYEAKKRREITDAQYPDFGLEFEKPKTSPVFIGSDCWLGKNVTILKKTNIEDKCVIAYGTLLSNISISNNKTIFNKMDLKFIDNKL